MYAFKDIEAAFSMGVYSSSGTIVEEQNIRLRLEQIRKGLLNRQTKLTAHVSNRSEPLPADFSEQAVELENDEVMVRLLEQVQRELGETDLALERLRAGSYFKCVDCSADIEPERLVALPTTTRCSACIKNV